MTQVRDVLGRARPLVVAVLFTAAAIIPALSIHLASAGAITDRSLNVTSTVPSGTAGSLGDPGDGTNGDEVGHVYTFTSSGETAGTVATIHFIVCDEAFGYLNSGATCVAPSGFDNVLNAGGAGITLSTGTVSAVTSIDDNEWSLTVSGLALTTTPAPLTITFDPATSYFVNPDAAYLDPARTDGAGPVNGTYFVHVSLLATGPTLLDEGTVTNAVATAIDINTRVQETLKFSVEGDMRDGPDNVNSGTPTAGIGAFNGPTTAGTGCAPLTGLGTIRMGDQSSNALSYDNTYDAASYFRLATNSSNGALVYYVGDTLRSGATETIAPIGAPGTTIADPTLTSSEQFGLGMIAVPNIAGAGTTAEVDRDGGGTYLNTVTGYGAGATAAGFESTVADPVLLASSTGIVQCDTGAVRYVANIADETAAGIYSTRIVYIASPSY